jgi:hypothetical protein
VATGAIYNVRASQVCNYNNNVFNTSNNNNNNNNNNNATNERGFASLGGVCDQARVTLGSRIRNSLRVLGYSGISIHQVMLALNDLDKVTRLSRECCEFFGAERAPDTLYAFINSCNRSVPHMDLVKLCIRILINLAKHKRTAQCVLEPANSLSVLISLLQAYSTSNPVIFMEVCILFIILAESESSDVAKQLAAQETNMKKIQAVHALLERRANFRQRHTGVVQQQQQLGASSVACGANNSTVAKKLAVSFTMAPEWSLNKKSALITLQDPLAALDHMLNSLNIKMASPNLQNALGSQPCISTVLQTPKSSASLSRSEKWSSSKMKPSSK